MSLVLILTHIYELLSAWISSSLSLTSQTIRFTIKKFYTVLTLHLYVVYGSPNSDFCLIQH